MRPSAITSTVVIAEADAERAPTPRTSTGIQAGTAQREEIDTMSRAYRDRVFASVHN
jgi:hypothetical protein